MAEWDPEFPEDWREHEHGLKLVMEALVRAYGRADDEHLVELVAIAGELAASGAYVAAHSIATIGLSYLLEIPLDELAEAVANTDSSLELARRIRREVPSSRQAARILGVTAFIARREGFINDALRLYRDAVAVAEASNEPTLAAQILQTVGAVLHENGQTEEAKLTTVEALQRYENLDDLYGVVSTELNLVEYAAVEHRFEEAYTQLRGMEDAVREVSDAHLYGSWLARAGVLQVLHGDRQRGRAKLTRALRNARRRGDVKIEVAVLGHLAQLARDEGERKRAASYSRRALTAAEDTGDPALISSTAHELAIDLAELEEFDQAIPLLNSAADAAVGSHKQRLQADLAAVTISRALAVEDSGPQTEERSAWFSDAESRLLTVLGEFIISGDWRWAARAIQNLRVVWLATDRAADGATYLHNLAMQRSDLPASFSGECFRLSGLLTLDAGAEVEEALARLRSAADLLTTDGMDRASELLEFAATAEHSYQAFAVAQALYDDALHELARWNEPTVYGNALNDSALVAMRLEDHDLALARLHEAAVMAAERSDRVLGSLVELNIGEILSRVGLGSDARQHFERAAQQAESFGDMERAAEALAAWANTYVNDGDATDLAFARTLAERSNNLAMGASSDSARARALSALASLTFSEGDLEGAYDLWNQARDAAAPERRPVYEGFLLETLARQDKWYTFNRQMERFAKASQKNQHQLQFAEQLWSSANVWLRQGNARRAAKVLAYSLLLAGEGHSQGEKNPLFEDAVAIRNDAMFAAARTVAYAGHLLSLDAIPMELRLRLRPELLKALIAHGTSEEDASHLLQFVEEFVKEDE